MTAKRSAQVKRETFETQIELELCLEGEGQYEINTGIGFFDHMLSAFAKHGSFGLKLRCQGDLEVDPHHSIEDVGICLGRAIAEALGDKSGILRYGYSYVPMDEALVRAVVDLSGRSFLSFNGEMRREKVGGLPTEMLEDFFRAIAEHGRMNLHLDLIRGKNAHHCAEAMFKAFGRALSQAVSKGERVSGVPSTKGKL